MTSKLAIKNILFDLDGTIIDSYPGIQCAFAYAYQKLYNKPCDYDIRSHVGPPLKEILGKVSGESDANKLDSFVNYFQEKYDSSAYMVCELYEGVLELLDALQRKEVNLFIVTNKRIKPTNLILEHLQIDVYFRGIHSLDYVRPAYVNKSDLVTAILTQESLNKSNTIMVGDGEHDFQAAMENDLRFFYANYGFGNLNHEEATLFKPLDLLGYLN